MTRLARVLLFTALSLGLLGGCGKDEKKADEAKTPADNGAAESAKDAPMAEAPAPPKTLVDPGIVSLEQAIATMGLEAKHRLVVRSAQLVESGAVAMGIGAIPADKRGKYDKFVAGSGFDPAKHVSGMLVYGDGDIGKFATAQPTIVFGLAQAISEKFVDELDKLDDDDDDDDSDNETFRMVFLAGISAEIRTKVISMFKKVDPGDAPLETETLGDAVLFAQLDGKSLKYGYLWSGGLALGEVPSSAAPVLAQAKVPLAALLHDLAKASATTPPSGGPAIEGRGSAEGRAATFTVNVGPRVVVDAVVTLPGADAAKFKDFLAVVPQIRANPGKALESLPAAQRPLARLLLDSTTMTLEGSKVVAHFDASTIDLMAKVKPFADKLGD